MARDIASEMRMVADRRFGDPVARALLDWADQVAERDRAIIRDASRMAELTRTLRALYH